MITSSGFFASTAITTPTANLADFGPKRPKMGVSQVAGLQPLTARVQRPNMARALFLRLTQARRCVLDIHITAEQRPTRGGFIMALPTRVQRGQQYDPFELAQREFDNMLGRFIGE